MESELPIYPDQIENTAERSVECFLDTDNLQQESEQIVGSDFKSVLVSTEEKLLPALTTNDETTNQTSELNEGFDEKFFRTPIFLAPLAMSENVVSGKSFRNTEPLLK